MDDDAWQMYENGSIVSQYKFGYSVADSTTGDSKTREEERDGDVVRGSYSVADPDGRIRTVTYTADALNGFQVLCITYISLQTLRMLSLQLNRPVHSMFIVLLPKYILLLAWLHLKSLREYLIAQCQHSALSSM